MPGIVHTLSSEIQPYHPGEANVIFENGQYYNSDIFQVVQSATTGEYLTIDNDGKLVFVSQSDTTHDTGISINLVEYPATQLLTLVWQFEPNIPQVSGGRAFMQYGRCVRGSDAVRCMTEGYNRNSYIDVPTNVFEDYSNGDQMIIAYTNRNNGTDGIFIAGNHFKVTRILGFVSDYSSCGFN